MNIWLYQPGDEYDWEGKTLRVFRDDDGCMIRFPPESSDIDCTSYQAILMGGVNMPCEPIPLPPPPSPNMENAVPMVINDYGDDGFTIFSSVCNMMFHESSQDESYKIEYGMIHVYNKAGGIVNGFSEMESPDWDYCPS